MSKKVICKCCTKDASSGNGVLCSECLQREAEDASGEYMNPLSQ